MNIVVCVKQVPDPNLEGALDGNRLKRDVASVLDPGDEFGIEAGLRLAEAHSGEVTVVTMGPAQAMDAIRKALSMGAAKGILITDDALQNADALLTARVLATAIKRNPFDIVISGVESTDGYSGVLPGMLAEFLSVPQATFAKSLESDGTQIKIQRQTQTGYDEVECPLPAVVTVTAGANEPRYPTFKGIVGAKSKPVENLTLADLGLDAAVDQTVTSISDAPHREAGQKIEDDGSAAAAIAEYLAKAKVV